MVCQHLGTLPIFTPIAFPRCKYYLACPSCGPWAGGETEDPFALATEWVLEERQEGRTR